MNLNMKIWGIYVMGLLLLIFTVDSSEVHKAEELSSQYYPAIYEDVVV